MPELPEVEITKRKLLPLVKNKVFSYFWTDWPRGLKLARPAFVVRDIKRRKIIDGHRVGKVIFLHLSRPAGAGTKQTDKPERMLAFHQRMSGRLEYVAHDSHSNIRANVRMSKEETKWTHFIFRFSDGSKLRFIDPRKFGVVWYGSPQDFQKDKYIKTLGIDLQKLTFEDFREKINPPTFPRSIEVRGKNDAPVTLRQYREVSKKGGGTKAFLLRQDIIAGVGNIMADESLWRAKIHPKRKTTSLSEKEIRSLFYALKKTTAEILRAGGTSMRNWGHPDGRKGGYQELYKVYDRGGEKCIRCGKTIKRIIVAGRGTSFCPRCQKI